MEQRTDSDERWVIVPGSDDCYEVSHRGRVWSRPRLGTRGGIMAGSTTPDGYRQVQLHCYGKMSNYRIHQLVALAFLGPTPEGMEICHKDGDQLNNDVSNLKFDTHRKNTQERVEHGHTGRPRRRAATTTTSSPRRTPTSGLMAAGHAGSAAGRRTGGAGPGPRGRRRPSREAPSSSPGGAVERRD